MSKSEKVTVISGGEAEEKIRYASYQIKILDYVNSIEGMPAHIQGEFLNQCVIFLEIAMGYRKEEFKDQDYKIVVERTVKAGVIEKNRFENILDLLDIDEKMRGQLLGYWNK